MGGLMCLRSRVCGRCPKERIGQCILNALKWAHSFRNLSAVLPTATMPFVLPSTRSTPPPSQPTEVSYHIPMKAPADAFLTEWYRGGMVYRTSRQVDWVPRNAI